MKKIAHKHFMESIEVSASDLPQPIQEQLKIFEKMQSMLEKTSGENHKKISKQLKTFDMEIKRDLEDLFEAHLQHNELEETETPPEAATKKNTPRSDEDILTELVRLDKTTDIKRDFLRDLGFKGELKGSRNVGKVRLHRSSMFTFCYDIIPL